MEIDGRFIRSPQRKVVRGLGCGGMVRRRVGDWGEGRRHGGGEATDGDGDVLPSQPPPPAVSHYDSAATSPQMKTKAERAEARRGSAGAQLLGHISHPSLAPSPPTSASPTESRLLLP